MKPICLTIGALSFGFVLFITGSAYAQSSDDSFHRGYQQGYQAENPGSLTPLAPIPDIPAPGQGYYEEGIKEGAEQGQEDNNTDYQSGYDQGYEEGQDAGSENSESGDSGDSD